MTAKEYVLKEEDGYLSGDYTPTEMFRFMDEYASLKAEEAFNAARETGVKPITEYVRLKYPDYQTFKNKP